MVTLYWLCYQSQWVFQLTACSTWHSNKFKRSIKAQYQAVLQLLLDWLLCWLQSPMQKFLSSIPVFWLLVRIFISIITFFVAFITFDLVLIYFNLFVLLDCARINSSSRKIRVLALANFTTRSKSYFFDQSKTDLTWSDKYNNWPLLLLSLVVAL